eukprot:CAMPEP_0118859850 /NCGR_PEP_ID=MMETSP1163-20130328/5917_1 /TAXON_ID=124430 /ORGANISM="Phaeomonas parva, Strain CCMP2877" /LENGTH=469 /DNA_ID=CAMNT_0006793485 /DNA_START=79 /DNA_END=1488 /DNA_ORIENTATION=+
MFRAFCVLALAAAAAAAVEHAPVAYTSGERQVVGKLQDEEVTGVCDDGVKSLSGYFKIEGSKNAHYFFYFFEARNGAADAPTAVWLTGGPGCSSQLALFTENGPCSITEDASQTQKRPQSWNTNQNIMWVDQPTGVGFSYGDSDDYSSNEAEVADDMYAFLNAFMKAHPEYNNHGTVMFGESYGGHYVPAISSRIVDGMKSDDANLVKLVGMGVGNGLTKPEVQYAYYPAMAVNNTYGIKTVSDDVAAAMEAAVPRCIDLIKKCQDNTQSCAFAQSYCNLKLVEPYSKTGKNVYDITKPCKGDLCYDFSYVDTFLNKDEIKTALHVADEASEWKSCNMKVNTDFKLDWMKNFDGAVAKVLAEEIPVLIYAGDLDYICNWMGNKAWTLEFEWEGKEAFNAAMDEPWVVDETVHGMLRTAGNLQFLQVYKAGHMTPMDQPEASLAMFDSFIAGTLGGAKVVDTPPAPEASV